MTVRTRRRGAALVLLLGVVVGPLQQTVPASAHAYAVSTTPGNAEELQAAPTQVRVTFDEPVSLSAGGGSTSVIDSEGAAVGDGDVRLLDDRHTLVIGVRTDLAKGSYIASWSVVSADSHPVGGSLQFGYGVPAATPNASAPPAPSSGLELVVGLAKGLLYLGLIAALGLVPAALVLGADGRERRVLERLARLGAGLAVLASVAQVGLQYLWDASVIPGSQTWGGLVTFLATPYVSTVGIRVGLLLLLVAVSSRLRLDSSVTTGAGRRRGSWVVAGVLALSALASVVRNGHGAAGGGWFFASILVHVTAAVAWLGGLATLGWLVLRGSLDLARLRRLPLWSRYAGASVGLLAATGTVQALVQVRHPAALFDTTYGLVLIVKLALVAAALLLGLLGHRWVRSLAPAASTQGASRPLLARARSRVRAEAGLGVAIVVVSGVLSSTPPAEVTYAPARVVEATIGPYAVQLTVAPARRGPQSFRVVTTGRNAATPPVSSLELELGSGDTDAVRALPVAFPYRLPGVIAPGRATPFTFVSPAVNVPQTGTWTGTLTLVTSPTLQYTDTFSYRVL